MPWNLPIKGGAAGGVLAPIYGCDEEMKCGFAIMARHDISALPIALDSGANQPQLGTLDLNWH
jgi:hypothetical protein